MTPSPISRSRDDRAVLLAEPVVVGAHGGAVGVVVGHRAARGAGRPACSGTAPRRAGRPCPARVSRCSGGPTPGGVFDRHAERLPRLVRSPRPQVEERNGIGRLTLDRDRVAAVGELDRARRVLTKRAPACAASSARAGLRDDRRSRAGAEAWNRPASAISWPSALGGAIVPLHPRQRPRLAPRTNRCGRQALETVRRDRSAAGNRGAPRPRRGAPNAGGCGGPFRGPPRLANLLACGQGERGEEVARLGHVLQGTER